MKKVFIIAIFLLTHLTANTAQASDCYSSIIMSPSPFLGNHEEIIKLDNGSIWQIQYEYEYMYEYMPKAIVCPSKGKIVVKGKTLNAVQISGGEVYTPRSSSSGYVIESRIDGDFEGFENGKIFKLDNGQIWEQTSFEYKYKYKYHPKVMIYKDGMKYKMQVDSVDKTVTVKRLE